MISTVPDHLGSKDHAVARLPVYTSPFGGLWAPRQSPAASCL